MSGRNYPADTQRQKFLEEFYNKERDTRIAWFLKVAQDGEPTGGKSKQYQVFRKKIEGQHCKPKMGKLPPINAKQFHKKSNANAFPVDTDDCTKSDTKLVLEMRPVSGHTRKMLYHGFSKEGTGRYQYLHERYQINPEEKYEYPILSSWEYGWRLSDVIKKDDIRKPKHGRTRIVADTFYTRTGVPTLQS